MAPLLLVAVVAGAPTAGTADTVATVRDGDGRPCPALDLTDRDRPRGGCVVDVDGDLIAVSVRTMVGDMDFAKCSYAHRLRVGGDGTTSIERVRSIGPDMCNDVNVCKPSERPASSPTEPSVPWRGRIVTADDRSFTNVVGACFDTCMGQFVGRLELRFERDAAGGWRAVPSRDLIGDTGLELDGGAWTIAPGELEPGSR